MKKIDPCRPLASLPFLLLACAVASLAISSQSFWIDEAQTALKALPPTFAGWWRALDGEHTSNMQLPLYMFYIWGWARLFHVSEFALRAANIPWFFLGFFAILHSLRRHPGLRNAALLLYCVHPFVWYYLDEARPYLMQLSGALMVAGCLFTALDEPAAPLPSSWWWLFFAGLTLLCGAGILGLPWAVAIAIPLLRRPGFWQSMRRHGGPALAVFLPLLILLALYFAWTVEQKIATGYLNMSLASMLAVFYEQLGFVGLGPGRDAARPSSFTAPASFAWVRPYLSRLAVLGLPLGWGLLLALRRRFGMTPARLASILLLAASPVLLIFLLGFVRHVRILGRHLTPLFPFILLAEAYAILLLWRTARPLPRAATLLILVTLAVSSLETRFAFRHSKDDYRAAAAAANQALAQGKSVWWAASPDGALYYHLPIHPLPVPGSVRQVYGVPDLLSSPPDEIILSKPEIFDPTGALAQFILLHHYHVAAVLQSFTIWTL